MLYTLCDWDMKHREENTGPKNAIFYLLMQGIGTAKRFMAGTELVSDSRFPYCYLIRGWKSRKIEDTWMKILAKFKQTQFSSLLKKVHPLRAGDRLPKDGRRRAQCSNWWLTKTDTWRSIRRFVMIRWCLEAKPRSTHWDDASQSCN